MRYIGEQLREIIFPLGGIGSGSIGLTGTGNLVDWEIFNRPNKGSDNGYSQICVRTVDEQGKVTLKSLCVDTMKDLSGQYQGKKWTGHGFGVNGSLMNGFPHFENCIFEGRFPMAELTFTAGDFPGSVKLTAFNPLIPHNADDSSLPAGFFEVEFCNESEQTLDFSAVFSLRNLFSCSRNEDSSDAGIAGVTLYNHAVDTEDKEYGDMSLFCQAERTVAQPYWYRGRWQDGVVTFWNELQSGGQLRDRHYDSEGNHDTAAVQGSCMVAPGKCCKVRFVLTWNTPNCYNYWQPLLDAEGKDVTWKNYYAVLFENSIASGKYAMANWDRLFAQTKLFTDTLHNSSLDSSVIDAAASTLSVLKSPAILRLEDGSFYGWEGCHEKAGSCEGTCQHVWNYVYSTCFLFPELERSIRENEFKYCLTDEGRTYFRIMLPRGRTDEYLGVDHACVDGQMGCVIKTYREWKISGDTKWLASVWKDVKSCLEFAWSEKNPDEWDRNKDGVLEGRQHHTLDMELFGPSAWLQGFYLAALKAAAEMAEAMEDPAGKEYMELFEKGKAWTAEHLFNGRYFTQQIDLGDKGITDHFDCNKDYWNEEAGQIKYQLAEGCFVDQLCAQWHADLCGLGEIFDPQQYQIALDHMWKYNFKPSMRDFINPWRVFVFGDEGGCVMCDYPEGTQKPAIPVAYCEECMTGFEYALAGLWAKNGSMDRAIQAVKAIRDRYDGVKRNPYNEIECGSNYARAMASFAMLPILSGMSFDLSRDYLGFAPRVDSRLFNCLFSIGKCWGNYSLQEDRCAINLHDGTLALASFGLPKNAVPAKVLVDGKEICFTYEKDVISFEKTEICKNLTVLFVK